MIVMFVQDNQIGSFFFYREAVNNAPGPTRFITCEYSDLSRPTWTKWELLHRLIRVVRLLVDHGPNEFYIIRLSWVEWGEFTRPIMLENLHLL